MSRASNLFLTNKNQKIYFFSQLFDPNGNRARAGHDAKMITLSKDSIDILNITTSEVGVPIVFSYSL